MRTQILFLFGLMLLFNQSCKSSEEITSETPSENVIATIADQNVTIDELKTSFNRNQQINEIDSTEIHDFYPSYINYRLKLYEGYQQGYDKDSTVVHEFQDYASEVANRYWIENQIKRDRIDSFSDRFADELKAFHILKEIPENALPADTLDIYTDLLSIRDSLRNGSDPELINQRHSSKRDGRSMGGQLSWITAGTTVQPFENALYDLEIGEVSYPVRSQFGYHLILLQEIRPRTPQRSVQHIFVRKSDDGSGYDKIHQAYEALEADSSWSDVLQTYSEDPSSINRDGSLGWVGYGSRFPEELVNAAIQTDPQIPYSEPIDVSYGYHIMKIDSIRTFQNDQQRDEFITNRMEDLGRLTPNQQDVYDRIAEDNDLRIFTSNFEDYRKNESNNSGSDPELVLIEFNNQSYTTADFQYWMDHIATAEEIMNSGNLIDSYRDYIIHINYVDYTRKRFPEFANQVDHFLEGLIVFKVNEEHIWNPDAVDQTTLKAFYESNTSDYKKDKTFHYTTISSFSDSLTNLAYQELENGATINELSQQFADISISRDSTSNIQNSQYSLLEMLEAGEFSEPVSVNNRVSIYILNDVIDERILSFDEAFNQVFSDYQPIHEENYMNELKKRYNLKLYPENLR